MTSLVLIYFPFLQVLPQWYNKRHLKIIDFFSLSNSILPVIKSNKVDGHTKMTISARAANSVQICFSMPREVKINHNIHCLNVDTSSEEICSDKQKI